MMNIACMYLEELDANPRMWGDGSDDGSDDSDDEEIDEADEEQQEDEQACMCMVHVHGAWCMCMCMCMVHYILHYIEGSRRTSRRVRLHVHGGLEAWRHTW